MTDAVELADTRLNAAGSVPVLLIAGCSGAALAFVWILQYGFGIQPCELCLNERIPYYLVLAMCGGLVVGSMIGIPRPLLSLCLLGIALAMLCSATLGVYHAGVEWKYWPGPTDCTGPIPNFGSSGNLLEQIETATIVRCDEVQFRFLGVSLAGYNAISSVAMALIAAWGSLAVAQRRTVAALL